MKGVGLWRLSYSRFPLEDTIVTGIHTFNTTRPEETLVALDQICQTTCQKLVLLSATNASLVVRCDLHSVQMDYIALASTMGTRFHGLGRANLKVIERISPTLTYLAGKGRVVRGTSCRVMHLSTLLHLQLMGECSKYYRASHQPRNLKDLVGSSQGPLVPVSI